jgi:chaperonin GroES
MKLFPLFDKVVVQRDDAQTKTPGGILLPDQAKSKPVFGKVLAVGPGKKDEDEMAVKVGDRVLFDSYSGTEVTIDGEKLLVMPQASILALAK